MRKLLNQANFEPGFPPPLSYFARSSRKSAFKSKDATLAFLATTPVNFAFRVRTTAASTFLAQLPRPPRPPEAGNGRRHLLLLRRATAASIFFALLVASIMALVFASVFLAMRSLSCLETGLVPDLETGPEPGARTKTYVGLSYLFDEFLDPP